MALEVFKKQASFYLREKLNVARLALTSVSQIELLTEEATNEDPWGPETKTMATVAEAAFELDEYERIVEVLHRRLGRNQRTSWRQLYKTMVVLEYLLARGPYSLSNEFSNEISRLEDLSQFSFVDQQGFDKGSMVRKKAERVVQLLTDHEILKGERSRAHKVSVGIQGFGSSASSEAPDKRNLAKNENISFDIKGFVCNITSNSESSDRKISAQIKTMSIQDRHSEHSTLLNNNEDGSKLYSRSASCPTEYHDMLLEDVTNSLLGSGSNALQDRDSIRKVKAKLN